MTLNLVPMPTTVDSILTVFDTDNKKIKIKLVYQRFGFKRKNKELQLQNIFLFCRFLEEKTAKQRFKNYTDSGTKVILFKYKSNALINNNYEILKDGSVRKNGKDFASLFNQLFNHLIFLFIFTMWCHGWSLKSIRQFFYNLIHTFIFII